MANWLKFLVFALPSTLSAQEVFPTANQGVLIAERTCLKPWFKTETAIRDAISFGWQEIDPGDFGASPPLSSPTVWSGWLGRFLDTEAERYAIFYAVFSTVNDARDGVVEGCTVYLRGTPASEFFELIERTGLYQLVLDESTTSMIDRSYFHRLIPDMSVRLIHDASPGDGADVWVSTLRFEPGRLPAMPN